MSWFLFLQSTILVAWVTLMVDYVLAKRSERLLAHALILIKETGNGQH